MLEKSGGEPQTTNNRMELTAVVEGLLALKQPSHVELLTDSVYVGKGLSEWMPKWKANGWQRKEKNRWEPVKINTVVPDDGTVSLYTGNVGPIPARRPPAGLAEVDDGDGRERAVVVRSAW